MRIVIQMKSICIIYHPFYEQFAEFSTAWTKFQIFFNRNQFSRGPRMLQTSFYSSNKDICVSYTRKVTSTVCLKCASLLALHAYIIRERTCASAANVIIIIADLPMDTTKCQWKNQIIVVWEDGICISRNFYMIFCEKNDEVS